MLKQEVKEKIIQNSISLQKYGLNDLAWNKKDAKNLINSILKEKIGILGGDVYKLTSDRLQTLYDNWVCEPTTTESEDEYHLRSKIESLSYIESYPTEVEDNIIFSITFTEQVC